METVLITGANRGLGLTMVQQLAHLSLELYWVWMWGLHLELMLGPLSLEPHLAKLWGPHSEMQLQEQHWEPQWVHLLQELHLVVMLVLHLEQQSLAFQKEQLWGHV